MLCLSPLPAFGQQQDDDVIWTTKPTHVDRSKQTYERLPSKVVTRDTRIWVIIPQRIKVIDNRSFSVGDAVYVLASIRAIKPGRLCQAIEGGRWGCGRMSSIFLGNLVRGKRLLCEVAQTGKTIMLSRCVIGSRDVAADIIRQGFGKAEGDKDLLAVEAEAQKLAAKGLWRNPACTTNFDGC